MRTIIISVCKWYFPSFRSPRISFQIEMRKDRFVVPDAVTQERLQLLNEAEHEAALRHAALHARADEGRASAERAVCVCVCVCVCVFVYLGIISAFRFPFLIFFLLLCPQDDEHGV